MEDKQQVCSKFQTMIGGQALIEGIYMRGPKKQATVVRAPDGIVTKVDDIKLIKDKYPILGLPIIRGAVNFIASMVCGVSALMYSADFYPEDEEEAGKEPSKFEQWLDKKLESEKAQKAIIYIAVIAGVLFSIGLFILLPTFLAGLLEGVVTSSILLNLLEGAVRIVLFFIYLIVVSQTKDMQRVFRYHGAEHKTIHCYEAGLPLTVENVRQQPRQHPRCGTSFLFVVLVISILIFSVVQWSDPVTRMVLRLVLLPVVVGIAYEINRYVGRHDNKVTRAISAPGLWMQNFTTREPDDSMMEVGIEAIRLVIPEKKGEDKW